jgi:hypothetical protein
MHFKSKNLSLLLRIKCTCACSKKGVAPGDGNKIARSIAMKNENRNSIKLEKMVRRNLRVLGMPIAT